MKGRAHARNKMARRRRRIMSTRMAKFYIVLTLFSATYKNIAVLFGGPRYILRVSVTPGMRRRHAAERLMLRAYNGGTHLYSIDRAATGIT